MRSSCHTTAATLGMTFFQKMRQLVAVLGMHHHLKTLTGFGLLGRYPASLVCARPGRCIGRNLVFDRLGGLTHGTLHLRGSKSPIQDDYIEKYLAEKELNLTATLDAKAAYSDADFVVIAAPTVPLQRSPGAAADDH